MEFKVKFYSSFYAGYVKKQRIGFNALDRARNEVGADFDACLLHPFSGSLRVNPEFVLTEVEARCACIENGMFAETCRETVKVPRRFLNQYADLRVSVERDSGDDSIQGVRIEVFLERDAVVEAWAAAGYPARWGIEG